MRRVSFVLAMAMSASGAYAQSRPMTPGMTCNQARNLVLSRGAIVLGTGTYTYDRYVRDQRFCEINETIEPALVPTRDTPQCLVGYRCRDADFLFDD
ncbi:hypothetical protein GGR34_001595 [Microvirga flocculans]|uniref:Uncharacterized protein n=1 Tax=Microvirga flocculans TaxID=217168 RepID=A0A7W6N815_9HYPH|nr:hypothetical protein [Microvirga flocculans]MBB4039948.1 hypothetical protein [Microvirga flocculans]